MSRAVFCTSYIQTNPRRYQDWIDYYTEFFHNDDIDLLMFNDGPADYQLDLKKTRLVCWQPHLGRATVWVFPGWKRSFSQGLRWCRDHNYDRIAHIESDCYIHPKAKEEFMTAYGKDGYYCGFCKAYNFPETALQILNSQPIINFFLDKYSCEDNLRENIDFEKSVLEGLRPIYILNGDRYEGVKDRFNNQYTFLSGVTLTEFKSLYGLS